MRNYKLRDAMVEHQMTMRVLAERTGLSMRAIARARSGEAGYKVATRIAFALGMSPEELFPESVSQWQRWGGFQKTKKEYTEI